ncbi:hypothetical protein ACFWXO_30990 [Kitasatospora sp. NPDC059088]|uniref:hypothetical protein n=1 Tax=Kitasatospora sp. NPDC059088 TaxID=3346722 RepID=UPI0036C5E572
MSATSFTATATTEATGEVFTTTVDLVPATAVAITDAPARPVGREAAGPARCMAVTVAGRTTEFVSLAGGKVARLCTVCRDASGFRPEFAGVLGGQCFPCRGAGRIGRALGLDEAAKKVLQGENARRRAQARALVKRQAAQAQADAVRAGWLADRPDLASWLEGSDEGSLAAEFAAIVAVRGELTARQEEEARAAMAADAARAAKAAASRHVGAEGASVQVTGVVTVAKRVESAWGSTLLVIVEGDGADRGVTVKGFTAAKSAREHAKQGARVRISGTVKSHGEYEGAAQTELTRIQVEPAGDPAESRPQVATGAGSEGPTQAAGVPAATRRRSASRRPTTVLRQAAEEGARIVEAVTGHIVVYRPRYRTDARPWASLMPDGSVWLRYSGGECHAEPAAA